MQTKKKRTETISETETILFVKNPAADACVLWCPQCGSEVLWIGPAALPLLGITRALDGDAIHKNGGDVCSRSLIKEFENGENI
jgi:hypothetical protein